MGPFYRMRYAFLMVAAAAVLRGFRLNLRIVRASHGAVDEQRAMTIAKDPRTEKHKRSRSRHRNHRRKTAEWERVKRLTAPELPLNLTDDDDGLFEGLAEARPSYLLSDDEIIAYASSFHSFNRTLSFVHIPKTGGSTLENANTQHPWGKCLFIGAKPPRGIKLNACPWQTHPQPLQMMYFGIPDWHVPVHFFPFLKADPYRHAELFAVVRMPPMERAISQYFWFCVEVQRAGDRALARRYCRRRHREASVRRYFADRLRPTSLRAYLADHGHWVPQYDYVVGPLGVRYVDHVLELPRMPEQYPRLGAAYGLELAWPRARTNAQAHNKRPPAVGNDTRAQLAAHFARDWRLVRPP